MKKIVFFIICFLVFLGLLFSQGITVTSPAQGQIFNSGDVITTAWTTTGISGNVVISLVKSDKSANYPIQSSVLFNASPVHYTIPASIPAGDYFVRVKQAGGGMNGISGIFTILGQADLLEGKFSISKIDCSTLVGGPDVDTITIFVDYEAVKDFVLCKNIPDKCHPDLGSMIVTYNIKNWKWQGGKVVPDYLYGCKYACAKGCGDISYPRGILKRGKGSFLITIHPKTNNYLNGIRRYYCAGSGWDAAEFPESDSYYPELTVTLTLCISYLDPPVSYQHKLVSDFYTYKIELDFKKIQEVGNKNCGW